MEQFASTFIYIQDTWYIWYLYARIPMVLSW